MQLIVMQHKEVIGTLTAVDPDATFARRLAESLMRLGEDWQLVEVGEPCDEDATCFSVVSD